jgi:signal peptidase I
MSTVRSIVRATFACAVLVAVIGGAVLWTQSYRVYVVRTGSMAPNFRPGDIVIDRPAQHRYHAGEVITFRHSAQTTDVVTHRITSITPVGLIHTKGDANRSADAWNIHPDQVRGSVAMSVPLVGYLLVFLHQPAGVASMALAALAIALLWRLFFATTETDAHRDPAGATGTSALLTA